MDDPQGVSHLLTGIALHFRVLIPKQEHFKLSQVRDGRGRRCGASGDRWTLLVGHESEPPPLSNQIQELYKKGPWGRGIKVCGRKIARKSWAAEWSVMAKKVKEERSIAEKWVERIDKNPVEQMQNDAVSEVDEGSTWFYIFKDGSSVYEKHRDDWRCGSEYVQCPSCEEWRQGTETVDCDDCAQAEAEDEEATVLLKSKVL